MRYLVAIILSFVLILPVYAQGVEVLETKEAISTTTTYDAEVSIQLGIYFIIYLVITLFVIYSIYGLFRWWIASGAVKVGEEGRDKLKIGLFGLILSIVAYYLLTLNMDQIVSGILKVIASE